MPAFLVVRYVHTVGLQQRKSVYEFLLKLIAFRVRARESVGSRADSTDLFARWTCESKFRAARGVDQIEIRRVLKKLKLGTGKFK